MASQFPADIFAVASGANAKKPAPLDLFGMSVEASRLPSEDSSRINSTNVSTFATPNPSRPGSPTKSGKSAKTKMFRYKKAFWVIKVTRVDRNNKTVIEYIRAKKEVGQEMKRIYAQKRGKERSIQRRLQHQVCRYSPLHSLPFMPHYFMSCLCKRCTTLSFNHEFTPSTILDRCRSHGN